MSFFRKYFNENPEKTEIYINSAPPSTFKSIFSDGLLKLLFGNDMDANQTAPLENYITYYNLLHKYDSTTLDYCIEKLRESNISLPQITNTRSPFNSPGFTLRHFHILGI